MRYNMRAKVLVEVSADVEASSFEEAVAKMRMGLFVKNEMGYESDWEPNEWLDGPILTEAEDEDGNIQHYRPDGSIRPESEDAPLWEH